MDTGRVTPPQSVGTPEMGLGPAWMKPTKVPRLTPGGQVVAGRRRRVGAYLVDVVVMLLLGLPVAWVFEAVLGARDTWALDPIPALAWLAATIGTALVYQVGLWTGGRSTVGMRLLGMRVVDARDGGPVRVEAGLRRWLALDGVTYLATAAGTVALLLAYPTLDTVSTLVAMGWSILLLATTTADDLRQGLHDKVARTYVVRR